MTVAELLANLERFPHDAEVRFTVPTHNYWHEIQAQTIDEVDYGVVGGDDMVYEDEEAAIDNAGYCTTTIVLIRG
jgi:hypothetical protein